MKMNYLFIFLIILSFLISFIESDVNSTTGAVNYLSRFGYIDRKSEIESRTGKFDLEKFLLKFQEFFKLKKTGKLDKNTLKIMNKQRCGVPDFLESDGDSDEKRRYKRYAAQGSSWKKNHLTWSISKFSKRPSLRNKQKQTIRALDKAFSFWAANSNLKFTYVKSNPDIDIRFEKDDHRDGSPFDGPNGTLAHAFFPNYGGNVHFDDSEDWTVNDDGNGVHLLSVAIHELGHSLGLAHSAVDNSVMYPTYDGIRTWLAKDDIDGIQSLYGAPTDRVFSTTRKTKEYEDLCEDFDVDAGLCYKPQYCIVFKGNYIYKFKKERNGIANGYPKKISEIFLSLNGPIDAAFKDEDRMYLIKKDIVYEFKKFFTKPSGVFNFRKLIPNLKLNHIDAIYKKKRTGNIYIFSGENYYRFHRNKGISSNYPKLISSWDNLPSGIDAILDWSEDETIFFKGNEYWVYNEVLNKMKSVDSQNVLVDWLNCKDYN